MTDDGCSGREASSGWATRVDLERGPWNGDGEDLGEEREDQEEDRGGQEVDQADEDSEDDGLPRRRRGGGVRQGGHRLGQHGDPRDDQQWAGARLERQAGRGVPAGGARYQISEYGELVRWSTGT